MKIAITSEGNTLNAHIDSRFGRCSYFAIYDTATKEATFLANPAKEESGGAGPAAVQFIAKQGVSKIYAGEFGGKIVSMLESLNIEMINEHDKTISEIIKQF
jgi:predicted Fe-Mo cluster-binding NifX family protein